MAATFPDEVRRLELDLAVHAMLALLGRSAVGDVIVPSLWHLARMPGFHDAMRRHVKHVTGARIWVVREPRP